MRVISIIFTILQSIIAFECTNELATYTISLPSSLMIYKVSHFDASVIGVSVDNSPCASLSRGIYDCQGVVSSTIELNTSMPVWDDVLQSSMFMEAYPTPPSPPLQPPPSPPPNIELYVADPDVEDAMINSSLHDVPPAYQHNTSQLEVWTGFPYEIRFTGSHPMFDGDAVKWVPEGLACNDNTTEANEYITSGILDANKAMIINMPSGSFVLCLDQNLTMVNMATRNLISYYRGEVVHDYLMIRDYVYSLNNRSTIDDTPKRRSLSAVGSWVEMSHVGITSTVAPPPPSPPPFSPPLSPPSSPPPPSPLPPEPSPPPNKPPPNTPPPPSPAPPEPSPPPQTPPPVPPSTPPPSPDAPPNSPPPTNPSPSPANPSPDGSYTYDGLQSGLKAPPNPPPPQNPPQNPSPDSPPTVSSPSPSPPPDASYTYDGGLQSGLKAPPNPPPPVNPDPATPPVQAPVTLETPPSTPSPPTPETPPPTPKTPPPPPPASPKPSVPPLNIISDEKTPYWVYLWSILPMIMGCILCTGVLILCNCGSALKLKIINTPGVSITSRAPVVERVIKSVKKPENPVDDDCEKAADKKVKLSASRNVTPVRKTSFDKNGRRLPISRSELKGRIS